MTSEKNDKNTCPWEVGRLESSRGNSLCAEMTKAAEKLAARDKILLETATDPEEIASLQRIIKYRMKCATTARDCLGESGGKCPKILTSENVKAATIKEA